MLSGWGSRRTHVEVFGSSNVVSLAGRIARILLHLWHDSAFARHGVRNMAEFDVAHDGA
jgi:hypothetical protein